MLMLSVSIFVSFVGDESIEHKKQGIMMISETPTELKSTFNDI